MSKDIRYRVSFRGVVTSAGEPVKTTAALLTAEFVERRGSWHRFKRIGGVDDGGEFAINGGDGWHCKTFNEAVDQAIRSTVSSCSIASFMVGRRSVPNQNEHEIIVQAHDEENCIMAVARARLWAIVKLYEDRS